MIEIKGLTKTQVLFTVFLFSGFFDSAGHVLFNGADAFIEFPVFKAAEKSFVINVQYMDIHAFLVGLLVGVIIAVNAKSLFIAFFKKDSSAIVDFFIQGEALYDLCAAAFHILFTRGKKLYAGIQLRALLAFFLR